jgi:hypothetical protein
MHQFAGRALELYGDLKTKMPRLRAIRKRGVMDGATRAVLDLTLADLQTYVGRLFEAWQPLDEWWRTEGRHGAQHYQFLVTPLEIMRIARWVQEALTPGVEQLPTLKEMRGQLVQLRYEVRELRKAIIEKSAASAAAQIKEAVSNRGRPLKYPKSLNLALEMLDAEEDAKDQVIYRRCKDKFPDEPLPKKAASFMHTVRRHRREGANGQK